MKLSPEQNPGSEILELVNQARVALEMPALRNLPKGIPGTSRKCVLGRSLNVEVLIDDRDQAYVLMANYYKACRLARVWNAARPYGMWNGWAVLLPPELNNFVHEFDACHYPQLASATSGATDGVISELRQLRFDWVSEQTKVADLLARARQACDRAQARDTSCNDRLIPLRALAPGTGLKADR